MTSSSSSSSITPHHSLFLPSSGLIPPPKQQEFIELRKKVVELIRVLGLTKSNAFVFVKIRDMKIKIGNSDADLQAQIATNVVLEQFKQIEKDSKYSYCEIRPEPHNNWWSVQLKSEHRTPIKIRVLSGSYLERYLKEIESQKYDLDEKIKDYIKGHIDRQEIFAEMMVSGMALPTICKIIRFVEGKSIKEFSWKRSIKTLVEKNNKSLLIRLKALFRIIPDLKNDLDEALASFWEIKRDGSSLNLLLECHSDFFCFFKKYVLNATQEGLKDIIALDQCQEAPVGQRVALDYLKDSKFEVFADLINHGITWESVLEAGCDSDGVDDLLEAYIESCQASEWVQLCQAILEVDAKDFTPLLKRVLSTHQDEGLKVYIEMIDENIRGKCWSKLLTLLTNDPFDSHPLEKIKPLLEKYKWDLKIFLIRIFRENSNPCDFLEICLENNLGGCRSWDDCLFDIFYNEWKRCRGFELLLRYKVSSEKYLSKQIQIGNIGGIRWSMNDGVRPTNKLFLECVEKNAYDIAEVFLGIDPSLIEAVSANGENALISCMRGISAIQGLVEGEGLAELEKVEKMMDLLFRMGIKADYRIGSFTTALLGIVEMSKDPLTQKKIRDIVKRTE